MQLRDLLPILLLIAACLCQDFRIPNDWRKPSSSMSVFDRMIIAHSVVDSLSIAFNATPNASIYNDEYLQTAGIYYDLPLFDFVITNFTHRAAARNVFSGVTRAYAGYYSTQVCYFDHSFLKSPSQIAFQNGGLNVDPAQWGLAAIRAYRVYQEQSHLDMAASIWEELDYYFITEVDVSHSTHSSKDGQIVSKCSNVTTAGGVFQDTRRQVSLVHTESTCFFLALSAYLFEATSDPKYRTAADLSASFVKSQLFNDTGGILMASMSLDPRIDSCHKYPVTQVSTLGSCFEGLSVYANVTGSTGWAAFVHNMVATTLKYPKLSLLPNGILIHSLMGQTLDTIPKLDNDFGVTTKAVFIRGLYTAWSRASPDNAASKLIEAFIMVQFNALLDLARQPGSSQFSPSWQGPPVSQFVSFGQSGALPILIAAVAMAQNPQSQPTINTKKLNTGVIIGISLSATAFVLAGLVILGCVLLKKRRAARHAFEVFGDTDSDIATDGGHTMVLAASVEPFALITRVDNVRSKSYEGHAHSVLRQTASDASSSTIETRATKRTSLSDIHASWVVSTNREQDALHSETTTLHQSLPLVSSPTGAQSQHMSPTSAGSPFTPTPNARDDEDGDSVSAIPDLLFRLNRALARLPQPDAGDDHEAELPPVYEES